MSFFNPGASTPRTQRNQAGPSKQRTPLALLVLTLTLTPLAFGADDSPTLEYPNIKGHGGVFNVPGEPSLPQKGSKVVVDVTTGAQEGGVNKGLARAARFVNLFTLGGASDFQMAVVLHGGATKEALSNEAYMELFSKPNPNAGLLQQLRQAGVEVLVCGQALTHAGYRPTQTSSHVDVALSAATAIINRQLQGFAYLPLQ